MGVGTSRLKPLRPRADRVPPGGERPGFERYGRRASARVRDVRVPRSGHACAMFTKTPEGRGDRTPAPQPPMWDTAHTACLCEQSLSLSLSLCGLPRAPEIFFEFFEY